MQYCPKCGVEVPQGAAYCPSCGTNLYEHNQPLPPSGELSGASQALRAVAFGLMVLSTVVLGFAIIPLAWCLPMTIYYYGVLRDNKKVSMGFKICTLIFVNPISGILMLCDYQN